jgi:cytochrome c-type biogenesis protein CcmH
MLRWILPAALILVLALAAWPQAGDADEPPTVREVASDLISQCGSGMILADHDCVGARNMKATIQQLIDAGRTKEEILDYFVASYGEGVLATPRKSGFSLTAWVTPAVAVALGAVIGVALTWAWVRRRPVPPGGEVPIAPSEGLDLFEEQVDEELRLLE